jgi:hypothetical protein
MWIGLGHYSRVGKDRLADYMVAEFRDRGISAVKRSIACRIKLLALQLYGWAGVKEPSWYDRPEGEADRHKPLAALRYGGGDLTPVALWCLLGEKMRAIHPDTWIHALLDGESAPVVIVPDIRLPNEVWAMRNRKGLLIKVVRPGFGPLQTPTDTALLSYTGWDFVVGYSGRLEELGEFAVRIADGVAKQMGQDEYVTPPLRHTPEQLDALVELIRRS